MNDILERLKASSKINGAYPKDIEDAIWEIERLRNLIDFYTKPIQKSGWDYEK